MVAVLFIASNLTAHSQTQSQGTLAGQAIQSAPAQVEAPDSVVRIAAESKGLSLAPLETLPLHGTFWLANSEGSFLLPMPWLPDASTNAPIYLLGDGQFLIDDTGGNLPQPTRMQAKRGITVSNLVERQGSAVLDLIDQVQAAQFEAEMMQMFPEMYSMDSEEGGGESMSSFLTFPDPGLRIVIPTNALSVPTQFSVILTNIIPDEPYDVLTKSDLAQASWSVEVASVYATTNFIPVTLTRNGRTNLFVWARYAGDSTGSGIPDWWLLQYFGTTGVDPYGDWDNDGWNNLQEYHNGTSPTFTNAPPPPSNVMLRLDSTGTNFIFTWQPAPGPISGYVISGAEYGEIGRVGPSVTTFVTPVPTYIFGNTVIYDYDDYFSVEAESVNGDISSGGEVLDEPFGSTDDDLWKKAEVVRGPGETFYLVLTSPVTNLAAVRISGDQFYQTIGEEFPSFNVPISAFTNGVAALSKSETELCFLHPGGGYNSVNARGITTDGKIGGKSEDILSGFLSQHHEFVNASAQLKQNLQFLLRSATVSRQFGMYFGSYGPGLGYSAYYPEPTNNYTYASYGGPDALDEVYQHFVWRNFDFNSADGLGIWAPCQLCGSEQVYGWGGTGAAYSEDNDWRVLFGGTHYLPGYTNPPPLAFTLGSSSYLYYRNLPIPAGNPSGFAELGLVPHTDATLSLNTGVRNIYGLPINSVQILNSNSIWTVFPGQTIGPLVAGELSRFFANVASPALQTVSYYFTEAGANNPTPGASGFATAQTTSLLVVPWGEPTSFTGWAKQNITNGYSGKFAYLQQYFDKAYKVNTNGAVTAQATGVLSPYGEFYPTETGPVALVTMADIETGQRGTGMVQVVKMQLDVNHDGIMDTSLTGPDNTSEDKPFVFWVNNNFDRSMLDSEDNTNYEDDVSPSDLISLPLAQQVQDFDYTKNGFPAIPTKRDLEDYARLWIPGLSSLLTATPTNYTVRLVSLGGVRIYRAIEPSGGTNYLFDELTASNQVANSAALFLGDPYLYYSAGSPVYVSAIILNGTASLGEHFIFCGKQPGYTRLSLQVLDQNSNIVCNADANIQFKDIKDMYERWTVGERPGLAPTNIAQRASEGLPVSDTKAFAFPSNTDTNTPYILFVHGWNMERYDKDRFAETAFKRLYWQGYQGRFGSFRWPTGFGITGTASAIIHHRNYDDSEYNAWRSAVGLTNFLSALNAQYPGQVYLLAHSMGNVVASEALRRAGTNRFVNTYVASQAAIPAHTYDDSISEFSFTYASQNFGPFTPNIYKNWFLTNSAGVRRINFYNTNDFALQHSAWEFDQASKPDQGVFDSSYGFDGYPYDHQQSYTAGAPDDTAPWNHFFRYGFFSPVNLDIVNVLANRYEAMAYAAQARSSALGRTAGVINLDRNVDLTRNSPSRIWPADSKNYVDHLWHSAEFRGDNAMMQGYWIELLGSEAFGLK